MALPRAAWFYADRRSEPVRRCHYRRLPVVTRVRDMHAEPSIGHVGYNTPVTADAALNQVIRRRARPTRCQKPESADERALRSPVRRETRCEWPAPDVWL